jgi:hypothetical protein
MGAGLIQLAEDFNRMISPKRGNSTSRLTLDSSFNINPFLGL